MWLPKSSVVIIIFLSFILGALNVGWFAYCRGRNKAREILNKCHALLDDVKKSLIYTEFMRTLYRNILKTNENLLVIEFEGLTTDAHCEINTISFEFPDGSIHTIDRDNTDFYSEYGIFYMIWRNCYIWDGEEKIYLDVETYSEKFANAKIVSVDIEDDAPEQYEIEIMQYHSF